MKTNKLCVQPRYYKSFHCTGSDCISNCCKHWGQIMWTFTEYEKLIHADMSDALRNRIGGCFEKTSDAFSPSKTVYTIDEMYNKCPMQDDEGLCMIQRELGEEYLSVTCRYYPRTAIECGRYVTNTCSTSCYAIVDTLCSDETAMELDVSEYHPVSTIHSVIDDNMIGKRPMLRYFNEILRFLYDIVSDKHYSLETAMVLGALAAQQLTKLEESKEYDRVPEAIESLRKQLKDKAQIEKIDNIQPNENYRIALIYEMIEKTIIRNVKKLIKNFTLENGEVSVDLYKKGRRRLADIFEGKEFYRRNIVLNMLIQSKVGLGRNEHSIYENWLYLCATFAEIELFMTGGAMEKKAPDKFAKVAVALMNRTFSHQTNSIDIMVGFLQKKGFTKPAHIALMLKDPI